MAEPASMLVRSFRVLSDPAEDVLALVVVTARGQTVVMGAESGQVERLVIDLLQALLDMPGTPPHLRQGQTHTGFRARAIHVIGEGERGGALLLDVGPARLPLVLDRESMAKLGRDLVNAAALLGPPEGQA